MAASAPKSILAIYNGDIDKLRKELDRGVSPDFVEKPSNGLPGQSLLGFALFHDRQDMIALLLERGANPSVALNAAMFSNFELMGNDRATQAANFFLDKGVDPNLLIQSRVGSSTPLHMLCVSPGAMQAFLDKGARVDEIGYEANRTVAYSPLGGCLRKFIYLNDHVDAYQKMSDEQWRRYFLDQHARAQQALLVLLKAEADTNIPLQEESGRKTPLLIRAIAKGAPHGLVQALLEHGADVLAMQEPTKATTLYAAVQVKDASLARLIIANARQAIQRKAANQQDADALFHAWLNQAFADTRHTALHFASTFLDAKTIQVLVEAGADYTLRDAQGHTPQDIVDILNKEHREAVAAAQDAQREKAERNRQAARESAANKQMLLGIVGAAAITRATEGSNNITDGQRAQLVDGYVQDRVNAINGQTTDNFSQAAAGVNNQLDIARIAAAHQATLQREQRTIQHTQSSTSAPQATASTQAAADTQRAASGPQIAASAPRSQSTARTVPSEQSAATQPQEPALDALAFCWQTKNENWLCDGKTQETTIAEKDLDAQLSVAGCASPEKLTSSMVSLGSARADRGQKTGWIYRCGKLDAGSTGSLTWNRDIRRWWSGIRW